jgi:signal peptidase II
VDRRRRRGAAILFGAAIAILLLDRLTKLWAEHAWSERPFDVIPGVLTLRFTTNSGGAFSLGQRAPWLFAGATIAVAVTIVVTAFRHDRADIALGLGLILGGAMGNLADRALRGSGLTGRVVDWIDIHVWPVFNLADSAIVIGALLLVLASLRDARRHAPPPDRVEPDGTPGGG